jgi:hypothetical protein
LHSNESEKNEDIRQKSGLENNFQTISESIEPIFETRNLKETKTILILKRLLSFIIIALISSIGVFTRNLGELSVVQKNATNGTIVS